MAMNCFGCGQEIKGQYSVMYCRSSHETYEERSSSSGILVDLKPYLPSKIGKFITYLTTPARRLRVKVEEGKHLGPKIMGRHHPQLSLHRFIGHAAGTRLYTEYYETSHYEPPHSWGPFGSPFGRPTTFKCYLHVACHAKYLGDKRRFGKGPGMDCYFDKLEHHPTEQVMAQFEKQPHGEAPLFAVYELGLRL